VNRTVWKHWLTLIIPDGASGPKALLWITGGNSTDPAPTSADPMLLQVALASKTVVAELRMVPNQPLVFAGDGVTRYEDAIIAYSFDRYWATSDANWPVLLPMVKSAVRAMDTVQDYLRSASSRAQIQIKEFVVSGGSKRGWTTWLCAAVDTRVVAAIPLVIDVLNMAPQMRHHLSAYGFYSEAIRDYEDLHIFERFDTPQGQDLLKIVDPYVYRDRRIIPRFLINSSGDQFFLPDSAQFYIHDLAGPVYTRYCPNTDHGLAGSDADQSLLAFYRSVLAGLSRPQFSWDVDPNEGIIVRTATRPLKVRLWQASNRAARDFRLQTIGKAWSAQELSPRSPNTYVASVAKPKTGWTAFFAELTFDSGSSVPYTFTTEIRVVPECLPYAFRFGLDADYDVDMADVAVLASHWLTEGTVADVAPSCGDGWVDFLDYAALTSAMRH
jgi:PhoPQ-activated pathogenicity-related protein